MAKKVAEPKITLEREYIIPIRRKIMNTQRYKRANKAIKAIKIFIARHMKLYDKDLRKIKLDMWLNNEVWYRGIKNPPIKIKVKTKKYDNGIIIVELAEVPKVIQYKIDRINRKKEVTKKVKEEKTNETTEVKKEEKSTETAEEKETKKETTIEAGMKIHEKEAKQQKHVVKDQKVMQKRQVQKNIPKGK